MQLTKEANNDEIKCHKVESKPKLEEIGSSAGVITPKFNGKISWTSLK